MFTGAIVLNVFGACWCVAGLLVMGASAWIMVFPLAAVAVLIAFAWRESRHVPPRTPDEEKRIGRLIGIWSAGEGVGVFVAINLLRSLHKESLIAPVLAVIVGVHFIPLARGMPLPVYYFTGTALVMIGLAACFAPATYGTPGACFASGFVLWTSSAVISARTRPCL
jgi:membrane protein implicated in regulation of membrane protease activity